MSEPGPLPKFTALPVPHPEQHFRWTWQLSSAPAALWPLVSNTDRFNRDCGYPPVTEVSRSSPDQSVVRDARRLRASVLGIPIEWHEYAFEWIAPHRFGVERVYARGPFARLVVECELLPTPEGGTKLVYDLRLVPSGWIGRLVAPFSLGRRAGATMERVFRSYDASAREGRRESALARTPKLTPGAPARIEASLRVLTETDAQPRHLVDALRALLTTADDLSVARIRPYAMADTWHTSRRDTLCLFLHATRAGLVDFSWELVCPHCRGARTGIATLAEVTSEAHCDACNVDFTTQFDQSVELTFRPNPAIRTVSRPEYCVGGPQLRPHIVAQQRITPDTERTVRLDQARPGQYRLRAPRLPVLTPFRVTPEGKTDIALVLGRSSSDEVAIKPDGEVRIHNPTPEPQVAIVEHLAWTDQATTAAEVTSLQLFRDLFSREVLRPGERIGVGALTVVFTDLKNSTQLYREIGDAPAFGRVLSHFEVLKAAVASEGGCLVKTMGDAIMAVFPRPLPALRAMLAAQRTLAHPAPSPRQPDKSKAPGQTLALKAGIHSGACLAINQNERLDYFGSTVNVAARLCAQCRGPDVIISEAVFGDPEVAAFLSDRDAPDRMIEQLRLKGFGETTFAVHRLTTRSDIGVPPDSAIPQGGW